VVGQRPKDRELPIDQTKPVYEVNELMSQEAIIINQASECTVKQFIQCAFEGKTKVLLLSGEASDLQLHQAFELIYAEYTDLSGLYQNREFEMSAYIDSLDKRVHTIERFLELQRLFVLEFGMPCVAYFPIVKKYGHNLHWNFDNPQIDLFERKLAQIEAKEKKYRTILHTKIGELLELKKKQAKKEFTLLESRKEFIASLNRLQQAKFVIDKNSTTVEELGLMIRDYRDQAEEAKATDKFKRNK
jgi:hypothetical protein